VDPLSLLWLFIILASLQPGMQRQLLAAQPPGRERPRPKPQSARSGREST
jgi:hypothetical protein